MSIAIERLKAEAAMLPARDRADLASFLIRTLEPTEDEEVEPAWDEELARRGEEIRQGQVTGRPADEVFAEIKARHA